MNNNQFNSNLLNQQINQINNKLSRMNLLNNNNFNLGINSLNNHLDNNINILIFFYEVLIRLLNSIRYQKFEGIIIIEIILIDDYSTDNCANEIKKLMKSGNRIILLKKVKK